MNRADMMLQQLRIWGAAARNNKPGEPSSHWYFDVASELRTKFKVAAEKEADPARDMAKRIVGRLRELAEDDSNELPDALLWLADRIAREFLPAEKGTKT